MKFLTKKTVLFLGVAGVLLISLFSILREVLFSFGGKCYALHVGNCELLRKVTTLNFLNMDNVLVYVVLFVLLFSLITYRMKEEVFQRWIRFAIWYIPLLIIGYFIYPQGGGLMASSFDAFVFILFISIFVITSIVKIVRAHKSSH